MKTISIITLLVIVFVTFCNCDNTSSPPTLGDEITKEIDDSGGTIEWKNVIVDIPENALSGDATVTLKSPDYDIEDSLKVVIANEPFSISMDFSSSAPRSEPSSIRIPAGDSAMLTSKPFSAQGCSPTAGQKHTSK